MLQVENFGEIDMEYKKLTKMQNIVFPQPKICYETEMYFRIMNCEKADDFLYDSFQRKMLLNKNCIVSFDTYFNGVSINKWKKYSVAENVYLVLVLEGAFEVEILYRRYINGSIQYNTLGAEIVKANGKSEITVPIECNENSGMLAFCIRAIENHSVFYGGYYATDVEEDKLNRINIVLNICNFFRESYIYRNINLLNKYVFTNDQSELRNHLDIIIADNSKTMEIQKLPEGRAYIFPQDDLGGTGGFARGLTEALRMKSKHGYTHIIMMDDDVCIEPEIFERIYSFLRLEKKEYNNAFIGGALLRMDYQHVQVTHGGGWDMNENYIFHKVGANMNDLKDVLINDIEDGASINAWWLNCMPLEKLSLDNLPYPFFFHMDDVEYDLGNCEKIININGICVWHEPFEYKPSSHLSYYNTRNTMITHIMYYSQYSKKVMKKHTAREVFAQLRTYRYKNADLVLRAVEDLFRGPGWLKQIDPTQLLEDVLDEGYKKDDVSKLPIRLDYEKYLKAQNGKFDENKMHALLRAITLDGHLVPSKEVRIVPMFGPNPKAVYPAKILLNYDPITDRAFITEKSLRMYFKCLFRYIKVCFLIDSKFSEIQKKYKETFPEMTKLGGYWEQYFGAEEISADEEAV
ncbi:MAG: hypothetical protein E7306_00795 [Butyrivibrio sp.]|nr:hypothetical protein [Butyrivibrio sp.]